MSAGATPGGTAAYRDTLRDLPATHFRTLDGLSVSSIGLGTYLGDDDDAADARYGQAIVDALHQTRS